MIERTLIPVVVPVELSKLETYHYLIKAKYFIFIPTHWLSQTQ